MKFIKKTMGGFERNMLDYFCRVNHGPCLYTGSLFFIYVRILDVEPGRFHGSEERLNLPSVLICRHGILKPVEADENLKFGFSIGVLKTINTLMPKESDESLDDGFALLPIGVAAFGQKSVRSMESVTFPWTGIRLKIILAMRSRLNAYWAKNLRLRMLESRSTPVGMAADNLFGRIWLTLTDTFYVYF